MRRAGTEAATMPELISATLHVTSGIEDPECVIGLVDLLMTPDVKF